MNEIEKRIIVLQSEYNASHPDNDYWKGVKYALDFIKGQARNVVLSGTVRLKKKHAVRYFDEDDGFVDTVVPAGDYQYRVLDVRGWKPRQIWFEDDWLDVDGEIEELEEEIGRKDQ